LEKNILSYKRKRKVFRQEVELWHYNAQSRDYNS